MAKRKLQLLFESVTIPYWDDRELAARFGLKEHQVRNYRLRNGIYNDGRLRAPNTDAGLRRDLLLSLLPAGCPVSTLEAAQAMNESYGPLGYNTIYKCLRRLVGEGLLETIGGGHQLRFVKRRTK